MIDDLAKDYQILVHFVPTVKQRAALARSGAAMPDGSFYIRNSSDLGNAINAVGRATPTNNESETARRNAVRRHIIERAKQMGLSSKIPDTWNANGSLKQSALKADVEAVIAHFGRKGMKWGAHVFGRGGGGSSPPVHADAARAHESLNIARKHGTSALSTHDLRNLNTRLQQEQQFKSLTTRRKSEGEKAVEGYLRQQAVQQGGKAAAILAAKYGPKGAAWVAKNVIGGGKHSK